MMTDGQTDGRTEDSPAQPDPALTQEIPIPRAGLQPPRSNVYRVFGKSVYSYRKVWEVKHGGFVECNDRLMDPGMRSNPWDHLETTAIPSF